MFTNNKKRRFWVMAVCVLLAIVMIGSLIVGALSMSVSAASSADLKSKLAGLKDKAGEISQKSNELENQIADNTNKTQTVVEKKANIDQQIEVTTEKITNLTQQIQEYNLLIAAKQEELDQAQAKEDTMNEEYKLRLRTMEETGKVSYWSILFKARSVTDLLDRIDMIGEIAQSDQNMITEMKQVASQISDAKTEIQSSKTDMESAKSEQAELQTQLESQRKEADSLIADLSAKGDQLKDVYATYDEMEDEIRKQIDDVQKQYENALSDEAAAAKIAEARKKAAAAAAKKRGSGASTSAITSGSVRPASSGFLYPLPSGCAYVSDAYGYRYHPIYGYYKMHYGVDLACAAGTPIYAAKSGTVTVATYGTANGYYVAINHNDGYSSVYAHMTNYVVSVGQSVSQGDVIGYVGSTGWATGPHLHFEILYGGANVNPMDYVSG